jgi:hypothetical protein
VTDPTDRAGEVARLRALLASTRLECDELAARLAELTDDPPVMVTGQTHLPGLAP